MISETFLRGVKEMINGIDLLKKKYPNRDEKDYQPSGMDLRLGRVYFLDHDDDVDYGLINGEKILPRHTLVRPTMKQLDDGDIIAGWDLQPGIAYICEVDGQIKVGDHNAQMYLPRSTLLRAGVNVYTALGDLGYNGHLSFLVINHSTKPFFIQTGERFAQLVDFEVQGGSESYNGDYQEEEE